MSNPSKGVNAETPNSVYSGSEPFFAFFSQAQVALQTLRLSLDGRIVAQTSDLASQMENTRRVFQHNGKFPETIQDVLRIASLLQQRVQSWDREVQNVERSKQSKSGTHLQQLRSEIAGVRVKSQMTERVLSKLEIVLHQLDADEAERLASEEASESTPASTSAHSDETDSVLAQVDDALRALVGEGLAVDFGPAGESTTANQPQTIIWDEPLLILIAQRSHPETPGDDINLRNQGAREAILELWMIPKFVDIANRIEAIASHLRLDWVGPTRREPVEWRVVTRTTEDWPRSPWVETSLEKLLIKRFHNDPTKLVAICAEMPADWRDPESMQIVRRVR